MKSLTLSAALLLTAAIATAFTGCVNQQKEVLTYRKVLDGDKTNVPATQPSLSARQPLTLAQAMRMANRHNQALAISGEDYVLALIDEARAASTFLPSISFAPTFSLQESFKYPSFGGAGSGGSSFADFYPQNYTDLPINASLHTNVVKDLYAVNAAAKTASQRKSLLLDLQQTVLLQVAQTYYAILQAEQSVRTLETSVRVQEARVQNMQHRLAQGVARRIDVLQSQADSASTRVQLTDARNEVARGRATLAYLLGVPSIEAPLADNFTAPSTVAAPDELLRQARAHRPDLLAAAQAINASAASVKSAWGEYAPSIGVNFNKFLYRESFPQDSWWAAVFTINLPIFEAGQIHNDVRAAYARLRQNVDRARQTDQLVNEDIHTGYADFLASRQRVKDLDTEARSAQDAYDAATHAFNAGTATNLDVLTAQDTSLAARLRLDRERFNLNLTYLALLRAQGLLDRHEISQIARAPRPAPGSIAPAAESAPEANLSTAAGPRTTTSTHVTSEHGKTVIVTTVRTTLTDASTSPTGPATQPGAR